MQRVCLLVYSIIFFINFIKSFEIGLKTFIIGNFGIMLLKALQLESL